MNTRIHLLSELSWGFGLPGPTVYGEGVVSGRHSYTVDPFPCYHHDLDLVEKEVADVEACFPIRPFPTYFILGYEMECRTNGQCTIHNIWGEEEQKAAGVKAEPVIVLMGKRIPLHPAMTRYLVAHEYGHAVDAHIMQRMFGEHYHDKQAKFMEEYAKRRGCDYSKKYGAKAWHTNIREIFANDFRIIMANKEPEFWPHPVAHPNDVPAIQDYWKTVLKAWASS